MKKRISILCCILVLLMALPMVASAAPSIAQIDFTGRQGWGSQIAPAGSRLYYLHNYDLYSMNKTGGNRKLEYNTPSGEYTTGLQAHGGYVYYLNTERYAVYRVRPGSRPSVYLNNVTSFVIGGDVMYYGVPSGKYIKTRNLVNGKNATVLTGTNYLSADNYVQDTLVFGYGNNSGVYNPRTGANKVYSEDISTLQARGSYVYWFNSNDSYMYRGKLTSDMNLSLSRYVYINSNAYQCVVSGDYFYYFAVDEFSATLYRRSIADNTTRTLKYFSFIYEPMIQPLNDYIWVFSTTDGSLTGYNSKVSK